MSERPIMFTAPMVRAILEGRKTETRRAIKIEDGDILPHRYGEFGDQLWVKEDWLALKRFDSCDVEEGSMVAYEADFRKGDLQNAPIGRMGKKRSMMFMPRWVSRITLNLLSVHMEPLHAITEQGARNEGITHKYGVEQYRMLWDSINAKRGYPWVDNPLVWVVQFTRA